jgi:hypothetical protein
MTTTLVTKDAPFSACMPPMLRSVAQSASEGSRAAAARAVMYGAYDAVGASSLFLPSPDASAATPTRATAPSAASRLRIAGSGGGGAGAGAGSAPPAAACGGRKRRWRKLPAAIDAGLPWRRIAPGTALPMAALCLRLDSPAMRGEAIATVSESSAVRTPAGCSRMTGDIVRNMPKVCLCLERRGGRVARLAARTGGWIENGPRGPDSRAVRAVCVRGGDAGAAWRLA